ncbi:F-box protein SKIP16-like isoform X2 [Magnolia sinica]|uniref:F-box protein SKIP16-like isoform X2 n=1 Tax=Magnolia sinica TaxID=86752 RepID=UPI002658B277|nr:F-box protein SKIP16-like isoform X2 [Magnolia sinica]
MGLENLEDLVIHTILLKLRPENAAVVACVNRRFRYSASDEQLWRIFCSEDLDLSSPQDPSGQPISSFKVTYKLWKEAFCMYPWPLVRRAKKCWSMIQTWMALNFPEAASTLQKGASEAKLKEVEDKLRVKLPVATRVLYRLCDGQDIAQASSGFRLGLIGGYSFYGYVVNVCLLPLNQVISQTRKFVSQLGFFNRSKHILVASSMFREKSFFLNCVTGQLFVGTEDGQMMSCVPDALISSVHDMNGDLPQDAMLLWLEEHGRRLQSGMIRVHEEGKIRSISLFPEAAPYCSTAVTNGVQIRASAVIVPELCNFQSRQTYYFSYSIRMRLLPQGCILDGVNYPSCQLYWRQWIIRANDAVVSDVNGAAVIGKVGGPQRKTLSCGGGPVSP